MNRLNPIHHLLRNCRKCSNVCSRAVYGPALDTQVMVIGQAPGAHEYDLGKPFAFTAGKTLFKWFEQATGSSEEDLRELIYFSAMARCFPGKSKSGKGDRVPSAQEIENCSEYLAAEIDVLKPKLIIAVGKVAIAEVLSRAGITKTTPLNDLVGRKIRTLFHGHETDVIALPHPSGVSRWHQTEPGKSKLGQALKLLAEELRNLLG